MAIWRVKSVSQKKSVTLRDWQVFELRNGDRHLLGCCVENGNGRVSTIVRKMELSTLQATSDSGRMYILAGKPGRYVDALYVWSKFEAIHATGVHSDVTASVWSAHLKEVGS